jgi:hypothetical protein
LRERERACPERSEGVRGRLSSLILLFLATLLEKTLKTLKGKVETYISLSFPKKKPVSSYQEVLFALGLRELFSSALTSNQR